MSNQVPQRVRRNGSPSTITKQGPIKAVKVFSLKQGTDVLHKPTSTSPRDSQKLLSSKSPDNRISPEEGTSPAGSVLLSLTAAAKSQSPTSPGSFYHSNPTSIKIKERSKGHRQSPVPGKWRASSADAVVPTYLTGQWPKDINSYHCSHSDGVFMSDKSTQTVAEWEGKPEKKKKVHKRSASFGQGDQLKLQFIKHHLQKSKEGCKQNDVKQRSSPIPGKHSALSLTAPPALCSLQTKTVLTSSGNIPRHNMNRYQRNSVEGLNMEIEKLVSSVRGVHINGIDGDETDVFREIPDGHRAPVPEISHLSCTRSIDTQTPLDNITASTTTAATASRPASISPSLRPRSGEGLYLGGSRSESTDSKSSKDSEPYTISSPKTSCPFVRQPPDGWENITILEESRRPQIKEPMLFSPVKPNQFVFKPSQGSAFYPLMKSYLVDSEFTHGYTGSQSPVLSSGFDG
ncbi:protein FAM117B-like [Physella acuta]|uniref:protein FAM117B-like n=1 Tax=Physella acuta TaxID=109671 RepID=UPI0027DB26D4|nr:protein FAM117B-like [Physella acuta]XP_059152976.1 protein FAM117B-like [Physella acuta]